MPHIRVNIPHIRVNMPHIRVNIPHIRVNIPHIRVNIPHIRVNIPHIRVNIPHIRVNKEYSNRQSTGCFFVMPKKYLKKFALNQNISVPLPHLSEGYVSNPTK
jgi:hypothetical protein